MNRRRAIVAISAALSLAGCNQPVQSVPPSKPSPKTPAETPASTASPSPTRTDSPTPTATEEPTAAPREIAEDYLDAAVDHLEAAVDEWISNGKQNPRFALAVSLGNSDFDHVPLIRACVAAASDADEAEPYVQGDQQTRLEQIRACSLYLEYLARAQTAIIASYEPYISVRDSFFAGAFAKAKNEKDTLNSAMQTAFNWVDEANSKTEALLDVGVPNVDGLDEKAVHEKHDRQNTNLQAMRAVANAAAPIQKGIEQYELGIETYKNERYDVAELDFATAAGTFEEVVDVGSGIEEETIERELWNDIDTVACASEHLKAAAEYGQRASDRGGDRDQEDHADSNVEALSDCGVEFTANELSSW